MADRENIKGYNGVSYGAIITVTDDDVSDNSVSGTFSGPNNNGLPYPLAFSFVVVTSAGVNVALADAVITVNSPNNGDFQIEDGDSTFALVADQEIHIIAQPCREE